jgi:hypothetical protein
MPPRAAPQSMKMAIPPPNGRCEESFSGAIRPLAYARGTDQQAVTVPRP